MATDSCFLSVVYICMFVPQFCLGRTQNRALQSLHRPNDSPPRYTHTFYLLFCFFVFLKVDDFPVLKVVGVKYFSK